MPPPYMMMQQPWVTSPLPPSQAALRHVLHRSSAVLGLKVLAAVPLLRLFNLRAPHGQ